MYNFVKNVINHYGAKDHVSGLDLCMRWAAFLYFSEIRVHMKARSKSGKMLELLRYNVYNLINIISTNTSIIIELCTYS